jgi:hypothetical protein
MPSEPVLARVADQVRLAAERPHHAPPAARREPSPALSISDVRGDMRIYISTDIEGVAGAVVASQTLPGGGDYPRFRRLMTLEANAAVEACLTAEVDEVVVNNGYGARTVEIVQVLAKQRARSAGLLQSPLPDSNRETPPYHVGPAANGGDPARRFRPIFARSRRAGLATTCIPLQPLCSTSAPRFVV